MERRDKRWGLRPSGPIRSSIALALALAIAALGAAPVAACPCELAGPTRAAFDSALVAFRGQVERVTEVSGPGTIAPVSVTLAVSHLWKGDVGPTSTVLTGLDRESCGVPFEVGHDYIVLGQSCAIDQPWHFLSGLCDGTVEYAAEHETKLDLWANADRRAYLPFSIVRR